ncbi:MAG: hypothetical protein J6K32_05235 [Clostridia bacterium]|nr:hypothetical protein [Clostridia bacterium]
MTQAQMQQSAPREEAAAAFKQHILERSASYVAEPMADLYRVEILGMMLDRYDELQAQGLVSDAAIRRTKADFGDIAEQMRRAGFSTVYDRQNTSIWPEMTEDETAAYIRESNQQLHKIAMGVMTIISSLVPMMIMVGISEIVYADALSLLGVLGMFGMIALGIYMIVTAKKPKDHDKVKKGRFSLASRLRGKLNALQETLREKSRRRVGKGIAMLVTCFCPIIFGAILDEFFGSDMLPILGVAGMFAQIGAGVYQLIMAGSEGNPLKKLLKD